MTILQFRKLRELPCAEYQWSEKAKSSGCVLTFMYWRSDFFLYTYYMHKNSSGNNFCVSENSLGRVWIKLVNVVINEGEWTFDENRRRLSIQNVLVRSSSQSIPDPILQQYANQRNINEILNLTFKEEVMWDFDVKPSFSRGSKSYCARLKDWQMLEFVIARLTEIPESKKAVMSFIRQEDYEKVLKHPRDDYLPCITTIQFRLIPDGDGFQLNTVFSARSIDAYQKAAGNLVAISMLSHEVADRLTENLHTGVFPSLLNGLITDVHIYEETLEDAQRIPSGI
jgi:thymidylate synthase